MNSPQYLTDEQWAEIEPIINNKLGNWGGHNANDNRIFVDACLYILQTKSPWYKLPPEYGKYKGVNRRFLRWRDEHVWDDILVVLLDEPGYEWLLIDDTQASDEKQLPTFTMTWMKMISPSRPLFRQVQKKIADKLSYFEEKIMK